jgi:hypothetical protein
MATKFKPLLENHPIPKGYFGDWLHDVTGVNPTDPTTYTMRLNGMTESALNDHMKKHGVLEELPIDEEYANLLEVAKKVLTHFQETGVLEGILLPFEEVESTLNGCELQKFEDIWLNYGEDGQGGQRNPKPKHILRMLRQWNPSRLTAGLARKSPSTGQVFVNEGQQRSLAGLIAGRAKFPYVYELSDDPIVDYIHFTTENAHKLRATDIEIACNNGLRIKKTVERQLKKGQLLEKTSYEQICKLTNLDTTDDEFVDFKIYNELVLKRGFKLMNEATVKAMKTSETSGICSNISQLREIFECKDYTDQILFLGLDWYKAFWSMRQLRTADLIGLLETIVFNKDWIFHEDIDIDVVKSKFGTALTRQWPNVKPGADGSRAAWDYIQKAITEQFPYKEKDDRAANDQWHKGAADRGVPEHMWIAQGFYSVLDQRLPATKGEGAVFKEKLKQPVTSTGLIYDLTIPAV